ncbi:MAG: orotate phosphoribosyltransferase [Deltaproteobacteria bacterium]|nr:orotate phosphoribosyltransferase [Deltaproteobacteria bacterium]
MSPSHKKKDPLSGLKARLAQLIQEKTLLYGKFKLTSGQESPYYINLKNVSLHPEGLWLIGELLYDKIASHFSRLKKPMPAAVGGLTLGADPIATAIAMVSFTKDIPLPAILVRKEPKEHGTKQWLEGNELVEEGSSIVVVEDVSTTGNSALTAVKKLREAGFSVPLVVSVVDREMGAKESFEKEDLAFETLFNASDFADH